MSLKKYLKFLEANIRGNIGIPGEEPGGGREYLSGVDARAQQRLNVRKDDMRQMMQYGPRMMELVQRSQRMMTGKKEDLEQLANDVIYNTYKYILDKYDVKLDIKFIDMGQVRNWMDEMDRRQEEMEERELEPDEELIDEIEEAEGQVEEEEYQEEEPRFVQPQAQEELDQEQLKRELDKRKLANLVIQGEAKNTKHMLHTEEVRAGISRIFGERDADQIFEIWDEITKIADKMDWIIPIELKQANLERDRNNAAGGVFVDWENDEEQDEDEEEYNGDAGNYDDEGEGVDEQGDNEYEETTDSPVIRARAIDFPMLLHESVKGIYELLSLGGIPAGRRLAKEVISQTGLVDEPEDWRYGPEIAADLRDFVNINPNIDEYPNIREELFKRMIDKNTMPTEDFLSLMKGILSRTAYARRKIDEMISEIIEETRDYEEQMGEYERQLAEWEEYQRRGGNIEQAPVEAEEEEVDQEGQFPTEDQVNRMSYQQIESEYNDAIERLDRTAIQFWSKYIK